MNSISSNKIRHYDPLNAPPTLVPLKAHRRSILKSNHFALGVSGDQESRQTSQERKMTHDHQRILMFSKFIRYRANVVLWVEAGDRGNALRWLKVLGKN